MIPFFVFLYFHIKKTKMYIIGIAGGSGSGKTSVVKKLIKALPTEKVRVLSQDAYYWDNGNLSQEEREQINFDHPSSIEFSLLVEHIKQLLEGKAVEMPTYSYVTCSRGKETIPIEPCEVLIVEGILIYTCPELCELLDLKVFVDTGADDRIIRIIQRDVNERGRGLDKSIKHYETYVKPMHEMFIEPTKRLADIIIPVGGYNEKGIDILTSKIRQTLGVFD
jgi:uridine kinase